MQQALRGVVLMDAWIGLSWAGADLGPGLGPWEAAAAARDSRREVKNKH